MNHRITIAYNDDLYQIITDSLGTVMSAVLFYDQRMTNGEEVLPRDVPVKVLQDVQKYLAQISKRK